MQNVFLRNIIILISGTAGAQAIGVLLSPLITRIYEPAVLGVLGTFLAIQAILNPIVSLSYPLSIVLPKDSENAKKLIRISIIIICVAVIVLWFLLTIFKNELIHSLSINNINNFNIWLPGAVLISALISVFTQWINRNKLYQIKAKAVMLQSIVTNVLKVVVGLLYPSALTLILVTMFGLLSHLIAMLHGLIKNQKKISTKSEIKIKSSKEVKKYLFLMNEYRSFAQYRTPQIVLNALSFSMPILLLASFFGPAVAGFYSLARSILGLPISLIGEAVTSVFYPKINEAAHKKEDLSKLLINSTVWMCLVGIIPFGIIVMQGPWLFGTVFGDEWHIAGIYAQWMGLWLFSGFINRPAVAAIPVINLQKKFLTIEIYSLLIKIMGMVIGIQFFDNPIVTVAIFSVVSFIVNLVVIITTIKRSRNFHTVNDG